MYVLNEETFLTRMRIILRDGLFVYLDNLDDLITHLHGNPNFIYDPRTCKGPLSSRLVNAFAIRVALDGAGPKQAEHQPAVETKMQYWMLTYVGR